MFDNVIGQQRIIRELSAIVENLLADRTLSVNILLRGKAGSGKTFICKTFLSYISYGGYSSQLPSNYGNKFVFHEKYADLRGHFVDEVHTVKNFEMMYPLLDLKRYIFCFASNEAGVLPEALLSRCFVYTLDDYTLDEITEIISDYSFRINFPVAEDTARIIADKSRLSPRLAKLYLERIRFLVNSHYYKKSVKGISLAFKDIGVYEGGYTTADIRYLQYISKLGKASLDSICKGIGIDKDTVVNEIEPFLMARGHIQITRGGRVFEQWQNKQL